MMADKSKRAPNHSSFRAAADEQNQNLTSRCQRLIPIASDHLLASAVTSHKRSYPPAIHEQSGLFLNNQLPIYHHSTLPISTTPSRKRTVEDDAYLEHHHPHVKRTRLAHNIESENQPPSAVVKRRSLCPCHSQQDWNQLHMHHEMPSLMSPLLPPLAAYHGYEQNLSNHFPPPNLHANHLTNQHLYMFGHEPTTIASRKNTFPKSSAHVVTDNLCLFSPQSNVTSPLRTTNFVLDSNQQAMSATILRTGNISPAHSDTSTESASTCSSDEQQFRPHFPSFHYQPSRSYRERENYEQLLDLAEKLSDPNRLNSVDVEQFFSYRYKSKTSTEILSSKQTACVICMSPFKNNQRIRVLPCQHEYHSKCIAQWFTMNSSCPICRRDSFLSTR